MAQANIKAVITAEDRASSTLKGFGNNVGGLGSKVASVAKGAAVALGVATAAAVTFGVKSASELQQARIAFETMLGSADEARKMMKRLSDFAVKTPFALPEVVDGAKSLLAYGIAADKILPTFKALGNIAAGVGKDKLPQLTLAFGQVRAAGKLTGMELRQFTEAGVPLLEILGKQAGKTAGQIKEDMENGAAPSFKEVEKAIFGMSEKGGKFFNLLEKQSKTLGGTLSNLKDVAIRTLSELVGVSVTGEIRNGSIFDILQKGAQGLLDFLTKNQDAIMGFFKRFGEFLNQVGTFARTWVVPALKLIAQGFAAIVQHGGFLIAWAKVLWTELKEKLFPALQELWQKHSKEIKAGLQVLGAVIGGVLILALTALLTTLSITIGIWKLVVKVIDFVITTIKRLVNWLDSVGGWFEWAGKKAKDFVNWLGKPLNINTGNLIPGLKIIISWIQVAIDKIKELINLQNKSIQKKGIAGGGGGGGGGGSFRSGGMVRARSGMALTRVGEEGAENVMLPVGSRVQRNIDTKLSGGHVTNVFNFNVGMYMGSAVERRKAVKEIWKDLTDIASQHGTTPAKMLGA